ncbi:MAG: hypothetical protein RLN76_00595 [Phycisphaeraceae bacterium]
MTQKMKVLPKRLSASMSEEAYRRLRALNAEYGYGNNYLLTVLLEHLDELTTEKKLERVFRRFEMEYGAPAKRDH